MVSLGVDTFAEDPIGGLGITTDGYRTMGKMLGALGLPTMFVMEGGYSVEKLGVNIAQVLGGFEEEAARSAASATSVVAGATAGEGKR